MHPTCVHSSTSSHMQAMRMRKRVVRAIFDVLVQVLIVVLCCVVCDLFVLCSGTELSSKESQCLNQCTDKYMAGRKEVSVSLSGTYPVRSENEIEWLSMMWRCVVRFVCVCRCVGIDVQAW